MAPFAFSPECKSLAPIHDRAAPAPLAAAARMQREAAPSGRLSVSLVPRGFPAGWLAFWSIVFASSAAAGPFNEGPG